MLDPEALGDHLDRLFRAAWALCGSREDAEDLVQETYARVLARPRLLRNDDDLGYLLRALRNTFISRSGAPRRGVPGRRAPMPRGATCWTSHRPRRAAGCAGAPGLRGGRRALPADFRDVLVAIDVAGLSYREAAKALAGARGATITSRLFRARSRVAESLSSGPDGASSAKLQASRFEAQALRSALRERT